MFSDVGDRSRRKVHAQRKSARNAALIERSRRVARQNSIFKGQFVFQDCFVEARRRKESDKQMQQATIDLIITLVTSWAPFVVLIGVFVVFAQRGGMRARAPSGRTMIELYELQLEEMKRNAAALERIAQVLERRGS